MSINKYLKYEKIKTKCKETSIVWSHYSFTSRNNTTFTSYNSVNENIFNLMKYILVKAYLLKIEIILPDDFKTLDKEEFKKCSYQVAKGFGIENPTDDAIEEVYQKLDLDGNGTIEFNEFKKYVKQILITLLEEM